MHAIDVEHPVQVIDLVLQDARVPPFCVHSHRLGTFVQEFHASLDARGTMAV